jgi:hypothetical protein
MKVAFFHRLPVFPTSYRNEGSLCLDRFIHPGGAEVLNSSALFGCRNLNPVENDKNQEDAPN